MIRLLGRAERFLIASTPVSLLRVGEAERRQRVERAKTRAKLAHRHAAEAHERSALQYEHLAAMSERVGNKERSNHLYAMAAEERRNGDRERAKAGFPLLGPNHGHEAPG